MKELNFKVDEMKCIHCGLCKEDCIEDVISFDKNGFPQAEQPDNCITCQHCFSVCPVGAISIFNKNPDRSGQIMIHNPEMILNLIKSRRSIRKYKPENVSEETLGKLKDMLKWIPTGCNDHKLHFSFIDDVKTMDKFRNHVNNKIIKALTIAPVKAVSDKFKSYTQDLIDGKDIIFRGAPHMLVVSSPITAPCAPEDPIIALSYFELYAQSLGLGTCWCGYAQICMKLFPELSEFLEIPKGYTSGYVMLFGNKDINYSRTTQPDDYLISSIRNKEFEKVSVLNKLKRYFWNFIR